MQVWKNFWIIVFLTALFVGLIWTLLAPDKFFAWLDSRWHDSNSKWKKTTLDENQIDGSSVLPELEKPSEQPKQGQPPT